MEKYDPSLATDVSTWQVPCTRLLTRVDTSFMSLLHAFAMGANANRSYGRYPDDQAFFL